MTSTVKLKQAKAFRDISKTKLQGLKNSGIQAEQDSSKRPYVKVRYNNVDKIYEEFNKQHCSIVSLLLISENAALERQEIMRLEFDNGYYDEELIYNELSKLI
ncbi:hypothetical protein HHI36_022338 [Cryptolaemus montrouzieri]|uniref:Uncharacterized protein n=1 Tax=Cryptolaemus montrouzieri TaxID=559131 RepID=A0ABD2MZK9_9CUCU